MREKMTDAREMAIASSNNLSQLRSVAEKKPEINSAILDSIAPVKNLLTTIFQRLASHVIVVPWLLNVYGGCTIGGLMMYFRGRNLYHQS